MTDSCPMSDCAELVRSQQKFSYVAPEDRLRAASLKDCSNKCSRETDCNTFSHRWTGPATFTTIDHTFLAPTMGTVTCPGLRPTTCSPRTSALTETLTSTGLCSEGAVAQDTIPTREVTLSTTTRAVPRYGEASPGCPEWPHGSPSMPRTCESVRIFARPPSSSSAGASPSSQPPATATTIPTVSSRN